MKYMVIISIVLVVVSGCAHRPDKLDRIQSEYDRKFKVLMDEFKAELARAKRANIANDFFSNISKIEKALCLDHGIKPKSKKCDGKVIDSLLAKLREFYFFADLEKVQVKVKASPLKYKGINGYEKAFFELHIKELGRAIEKKLDELAKRYDQKLENSKGIYCSSKKLGNEVYTRCE